MAAVVQAFAVSCSYQTLHVLVSSNAALLFRCLLFAHLHSHVFLRESLEARGTGLKSLPIALSCRKSECLRHLILCTNSKTFRSFQWEPALTVIGVCISCLRFLAIVCYHNDSVDSTFACSHHITWRQQRRNNAFDTRLYLSLTSSQRLRKRARVD